MDIDPVRIEALPTAVCSQPAENFTQNGFAIDCKSTRVER